MLMEVMELSENLPSLFIFNPLILQTLNAVQHRGRRRSALAGQRMQTVIPSQVGCNYKPIISTGFNYMAL
jgi:hypothetical protein